MRWMDETMPIASALPGEENRVSEWVGTPCDLCDGKSKKTTRFIMWVCRIGRYLLMSAPIRLDEASDRLLGRKSQTDKK
jgi:hypothetical protein